MNRHASPPFSPASTPAALLIRCAHAWPAAKPTALQAAGGRWLGRGGGARVGAAWVAGGAGAAAGRAGRGPRGGGRLLLHRPGRQEPKHAGEAAGGCGEAAAGVFIKRHAREGPCVQAGRPLAAATAPALLPCRRARRPLCRRALGCAGPARYAWWRLSGAPPRQAH